MFKVPEDVENKYRFVALAALRAEQLQVGALPRIQTPSRKPTVVAQEEVAAGVVQPVEEAEPSGEAAAAGEGEEE